MTRSHRGKVRPHPLPPDHHEDHQEEDAAAVRKAVLQGGPNEDPLGGEEGGIEARGTPLGSGAVGLQEDGPAICSGAPGYRVPRGICLIGSGSGR